jgi:osmotically inducible protein OsmC
MRAVTFQRSAELAWRGDVVRGSGEVSAGTGSFTVAARFPTLRGEPPGTTTPEELLAASHAACYGIGLRSVIARHGGSAATVRVTATLTAEKGADGIRIRRSHLSAVVRDWTAWTPLRSTRSQVRRSASAPSR